MKRFGKRTTEKRNSILTLMLILSLLTGCAAGTAAAETAKGAFDRVIALSRSNAELWILAGGKLIATSDDAAGMDGLNEDVQFLGDMDHVSLEAIAALSPDLLILFSTEPAQKALGEAAEGIGIHVYYTNIDSFDDYDRVMKELTGFTGCSGAYERHVEQVREEIGGILRQVPEKAEKDSYLLLHVSATKSKAEKNDYFACEILNGLGLDNLAGDSSAFDVLSMEAIVAADPDYIFVVPRGNEKKAAESYEKLFSSQPAWEALSAVRDGRHFLLDKNLFGLKPNARWAEAYREAYDLLYGQP